MEPERTDLDITNTSPSEVCQPENEPDAQPAAPVISFDLRDKLLLPITWAAGYLFLMLILQLRSISHVGAPGAAVSLFLIGLMAILVWYCRNKAPLKKQLLPLGIGTALLALTFAVYPSTWLRYISSALSTALCLIWAFYACGLLGDSLTPMSLMHSIYLYFSTRWKNIGKPFLLIASLFRNRSKNWLYIVLGIIIALPLLAIVMALLSSADAVFGEVIRSIGRALTGDYLTYLLRIAAAFFFGLFLYSGLYSLRRDSAEQEFASPVFKISHLLTGTILVLVDIVYAMFVVIQFAYLFGGADQLPVSGMSYAEYARSGFFELVFIGFINLAIVLTAVSVTRSEQRSSLVIRILCTALIGMSLVILASAAFRMSMYISEYAMSILRLLTLWGMALLLIWFIAALRKIWVPETRFFRILFATAVAGWVLLSAACPEAIVARSNVEAYRSGAVEHIDAYYLKSLGPAALPALRSLQQYAQENPDDPNINPDSISKYAADLKNASQDQCSSWITWNLTAAIEGWLK